MHTTVVELKNGELWYCMQTKPIFYLTYISPQTTLEYMQSMVRFVHSQEKDTKYLDTINEYPSQYSRLNSWFGAVVFIPIWYMVS